jgi:riboflavin synthase
MRTLLKVYNEHADVEKEIDILRRRIRELERNKMALVREAIKLSREIGIRTQQRKID